MTEDCQHENRSTLSEGPPDFTPVVDADGEPVWICLDCHATSEDQEAK